MKYIFTTKKGIFSIGLFIGIAAATLQKLGNPANMGICVACFVRDIAGALPSCNTSVLRSLDLS